MNLITFSLLVYISLMYSTHQASVSHRGEGCPVLVFMKGLAAPIQDLLVPLDLPSDVDSLIALAIWTDNRLSQFRRQRGGRPTATERHPLPPTSGGATPHRPPESTPHTRAEQEEETMQLGRARLMPEERRKCQLEGEVFLLR